MRNYVKNCMEAHPELQHRLEFLRCVLRSAQEATRKKGEEKDWVLKGTWALVELSRKCGPEAFITLVDIKAHAGIESPSVGLWPWAGSVGAGLLEERVQDRRKEYRIHKEYYFDFLRLLEENVAAKERSITELEGLGQEIWDGVDPMEYIKRERKSWDG